MMEYEKFTELSNCMENTSLLDRRTQDFTPVSMSNIAAPLLVPI